MLECVDQRDRPGRDRPKTTDDNSPHFSIIKKRHVLYHDASTGMFRICVVVNETADEKAVISIIRMYTYTRSATNVQPHHPRCRASISRYYTGWVDRVLHLVGMQTAETKESSERSPRSFSENVSSFILTRTIQARAFGCL